MGVLQGPRRRRHRCPLRFSQGSAAYPLVFMIPIPVVVLSQVRQNYHHDCESALNSHIQLQLYASYIYLSMAFYCDRSDVALKNFASFFLRKSRECTSHLETFLTLQNRRGGHIFLHRISKPECDDWVVGLPALECAFHMELTLNQSLLALHQLAASKGDAQLCNFLKRHFLPQKVQVLGEMSHHLTILSQMGAAEGGIAEYLFEKFTLDETNETKSGTVPKAK